jgi:predicted transcriptional regulator
VGDAAERLRATGWDWCAVLNEQLVLLGRLRAGKLQAVDPATAAVKVMEEGPSTYRPSVGVEEILERMRKRRFDLAFVTDSDGRFLGTARRSDLERQAR